MTGRAIALFGDQFVRDLPPVVQKAVAEEGVVVEKERRLSPLAGLNHPPDAGTSIGCPFIDAASDPHPGSRQVPDRREEHAGHHDQHSAKPDGEVLFQHLHIGFGRLA